MSLRKRLHISNLILQEFLLGLLKRRIVAEETHMSRWLQQMPMHFLQEPSLFLLL